MGILYAMRVLVVEDEHKIANSIKKGLEQESFAVDVAYDGIDGYDLASSEPYDVILLDLMLPGMSGMEICAALRKNKIHTPVLMLTARGEIEDRVKGLNTGADDYLVKPFAFEELVARIKAIARRPKETTEATLSLSNLTLDTTSFAVKRAGKSIELTRKEFSLLAFLLRHQGQTLSKEQIMESVWSYEADILPNTVEVYMGYLRNKIDRAFPKEAHLVHTVRGFGYKLSM